MEVKQDKYSNSGNAWKVWDSSLVMARWVFAHSDLFANKIVHEVGSGCGLVLFSRIIRK
jgi:predicted nicotinamide N-methyase